MKPHKILASLLLPVAVLAPSAAPAQTPPAATAKPTAAPTATAAASATATAAASATAAPQAATAAPTTTAAPESAETEEGRAHFKRAVDLFHENNFRAALVEFNRAYEISHNYRVLYNIGQTQYELLDYAAALRSFERYLNIGGAEIEAGRRTRVEADIKSLGTRVARLTVISNTPDAEVLVDDVSVGKTPLPEPLVVSIGRRKVVVQKGGVASTPRTVDLAGGDKIDVTIDLHEVKAGEADAPSRTGVWVSLAVTGGLVAGAAIVGGLALSAHDDAQKKLDTFGATKGEIDAARSKVQTMSLAADILGGTAIAMAGVTIILAATGGKSDPAPAPKAAITVGPRGIAVRGSF